MANVEETAGFQAYLRTRRRARTLEWLRRYVCGTTTFVFVVLAWYGVTASGWVSELLMPPPHLVLGTLVEMILSGELLEHIVMSAKRILVGYAMGVGSAIPLGLLIGRSKLVRDFVDPLVNTLRPIPSLAFLPLAILWFGIDEASKLFLLWLGTFFVTLVVVIEGVYSIDPILIRVAINYDANEYKIFRYVILPAVVPFILAGMRQSVATAFRVIVAAEMIAAQTGIGFLILHASQFYRTDRVMVGIMMLGFLGFMMDALLRFVADHWVLRYRRKGEITV